MSEQNIVILDNNLVKASYKLSLNEMRLLMVLLSKIPPKMVIDPKQPFYVTKDDFVRMGSHPDNVVRDIRTACSDLRSREVVIETLFGELVTSWVHNVLHFKTDIFQKLKSKYPNSKYDEEFINQLRLHNLLEALPTLMNKDENVMARIVLHDDIIPYVSELKEKFTKLNLDIIAQFSSYYTFRFYLLIMQWQGQGKIILNIKDIRKMFDLGNKYQATKDLKVWVIDVATNEINAKSPYKVEYKLFKTGRKFTHLELKFRPKEQTKNIENNENQDTKTIDIFNNLNKKEQCIIQGKISDYIAHLETKGELVNSFHRKNIENKAIAERWGLDEYYEQLQQAENERQAKQAQLEQERQVFQAEQAQKVKEEQENQQFIAYFESLPIDEQNYILAEVTKIMPEFFLSAFETAKAQNIAHKDVMFRGNFRQVMGI